MPEMHVRVRWPDGAETRCYSPSLVIADHLALGATYPVPDFVARTKNALAIASERVRARYGYPCSRAIAQSASIERLGERFEATTDRVTVVAFERNDA